MPFRGPGMHEAPPINQPLIPKQPPAINPRMQEDLDIRNDQFLHGKAERLAELQEYDSPIRTNERAQRIKKLMEKFAKDDARRKRIPGIDNLVPKGMDPFAPNIQGPPAPMGPPPVPPGRNPFGPKQ